MNPTTYQADLHTHTIASGHGSGATITDMAKAAAAKGLRLLGISDHGPATPGGTTPSYFRSLAQAPKKRLDYTIASMHPAITKPGTKEENTSAYLAAIKNPYVQIIGHCDDSRYPVDYPALVSAAASHRTIFEINAASLRPDGYRGDTRQNNLMLLHLCKHYDHPVLLSSDSHGTAHIGDFSSTLALLRMAEMPERLILNNSIEKLRMFLA